MPTVASFVLAGLECWFWSNDHRPPRFHVQKRGAWELKVRFLQPESSMFEVVWQTQPIKSKTLKELVEKVRSHRAELLLEWEGKVQTDDIDP